MRLSLDSALLMEALNIRDGVFAPLNGFMTEAVYRSVVNEMHLPSGSPWTLPVTLDLSDADRTEAARAGRVELVWVERDAVRSVASLTVESIFRTDDRDVQLIYGVDDPGHPGVEMERRRSPWRIGGRLDFSECDPSISRGTRYITPAAARRAFAGFGWNTIVGFQTRNAVHRAHEYLQRVGLEIADGLFIHPLIGWKKEGDAGSAEILAAYDVMIEHFYPVGRAMISTFETPMRYAGPREAVFHAIVRRNYGCTHFIVGRDHAGVGGYYGKYEAQKLCLSFADLGITILPLAGPYHCDRCGGIVTERTCRHPETAPESVREISGSVIRDFLARGVAPPPEMMRPEVAAAILKERRTGGIQA